MIENVQVNLSEKEVALETDQPLRLEDLSKALKSSPYQISSGGWAATNKRMKAIWWLLENRSDWETRSRPKWNEQSLGRLFALVDFDFK